MSSTSYLSNTYSSFNSKSQPFEFHTAAVLQFKLNISSGRSSSPDTCHCMLDFIVLVITRLVWLDKTSLMLFEIKQKHGQNHKMTASCNLSLRCRFLEIKKSGDHPPKVAAEE